MATAPQFRARSPRGARRRAAAVLLAGAAAFAELGAYAWHHRIDVARSDADPVKLPAPAWRSLLTASATPEGRCTPSVPIAVLYVSRTCQHCQAELARWAAMVRRKAPPISCVGLVIVARPGDANVSADWVPPELSPMLLWDRNAEIASALGVRAVPLASYITPDGTEIAMALGEQSEAAIANHLLELHRSSRRLGGTH
jgi:hypothetical protein